MQKGTQSGAFLHGAIPGLLTLICCGKYAMGSHAAAQEKTFRVLSEMSVRLQTIEHRMEVYHKQSPPAPPQ